MSTGRIILIGGAAAGAGYAIHRYLRNSGKGNGAQSDEAAGIPSNSGIESSVILPDVDRPGARTPINKSRNIDGKVQESPDELLAQAREYDPDITLDELTGARLIASEHASGTPVEQACIADSECNRAQRRGLSLFDSVTRGHGFGKQGRERPASTRRDPNQGHLWVSQSVVAGDARGISGEAIRFYDPLILQKQNRRYLKWLASGRIGKKPAIVSCDALTLLEAWSYDYGKKGGNRCPPDRSKPGRNTLAWVGPIPGVDPLRLLLMKPMAIGPEHTRMYQAARDILKRGL